MKERKMNTRSWCVFGLVIAAATLAQDAVSSPMSPGDEATQATPEESIPTPVGGDVAIEASEAVQAVSDVAPPRIDGLYDSSDLNELVPAVELVFDGVLTGATVRQPDGLRILVTDYTFRVDNCIIGDCGEGSITLINVGGVLPNGDGMASNESLKLTTGQRYIVFVRPDAGQLVVPFERVLQVHEDGAKVADEFGRVLVGLEDGRMLFRSAGQFNSLDYLSSRPAPAAPAPELNLPPDWGTTPIPPQPKPVNRDELDPIGVDSVISAIADAGNRVASDNQSNNNEEGK